MAECVLASIAIGGAVSAAQYAHLCDEIAHHDLSSEWGGDPFVPGTQKPDAPLRLHASDVAWGRFESLETYLTAERIPFVRWSDASPGSFAAERLVSCGDGSETRYLASEDDDILIGKATVEQLGSFDAVMGYFAAADFAVPPLVVGA